MGRLDDAERWRLESETAAPGQWFAELWAAHIHGLRLLWAGDKAASDVLLRVEEITLAAGIGEPCHMHWGGHGVAAHLAAGRHQDARRVVEWHDERAKVLPCRWPRIVASFGRGLIAEAEADDSVAKGEFEAALRLHADVELPLHRVQALLAYGGFLRRRGHPSEARPKLADAVREAERCQAGWLAATAREELRLAGGRRRRAGEDPDRLTEAELRVARLAAEGSTNAEIARSLYLSVNTVATHLKHVYSKLEIRSRRELRGLESELQGRRRDLTGTRG
jgi:DNA-binding CsgD family transcriptional regulator